jgi:hypothetical protein
MAVDLGLTPGAQRVGGAGRLDLDDLGAEVSEGLDRKSVV